ncbi:MAG: hypothetical protein HY567_02180 [Candidatus Kerfeldbacteria bacterium]|nr:hypothetical protein [Candidatus Kerfeldbacteria bacterium]
MLLLDSTRSSELRVGLMGQRLVALTRRFDQPASSHLLRLADELLKKHKATVKDVRGIVVASGPGPFSALRTACALANAMSFALRVPAAGVRGELTMKQLAEQGRKKLPRAKLGSPVMPFYGTPPNITRPPRRLRRHPS